MNKIHTFKRISGELPELPPPHERLKAPRPFTVSSVRHPHVSGGLHPGGPVALPGGEGPHDAAGPGRQRQLPHRGQRGHQCRRTAAAALRLLTRDRAGPGGGELSRTLSLLSVRLYFEIT